jgi:tetratricopeptide (TPR) repeat protein
LGTTVIFIHDLTDSPQFDSPGWTMPMLFVLLGLTITVGRPLFLQAGWKQIGAVRLKWYRQRAGLVSVGLIVLLGLAGLFWRPLLSGWYANLGTVYQTRADLTPNLDDAAREDSSNRAATYFERALTLNPENSVANRRLGILLLDRGSFEQAIIHLEQALQRESQNQATLKALGFAYLWTGELDTAEALLTRLDPPGDLVNQLQGWRWWWQTQQRPELSDYADKMLQRLPRRNR